MPTKIEVNVQTGQVVEVEWTPPPPPPPRDFNAEDLAALSRVLAGQGSPIRALAMVVFQEINKLRIANGDPAYTLEQFRAALFREMRDGRT